MRSNETMRRYLPLVMLVILLVAPFAPQDATAQQNPPTPAPQRPATDLLHIVERGQSLTIIAQLYGVGVDEIVQVNGLSNQNRLEVGQNLVIPATPPPPPSPTFTVTPRPTQTQVPPATVPGDAAPVNVSAENAAQDTGAAESAPVVAALPTADVPLSAWGGWPLNLGIISPGGTMVRDIYRRGRELGNNPRAFSKIGDCNSEVPFFLAKFDDGGYDLGPYSYLQPVIDHFAGSFERDSVAVWVGNHMWAVQDPLFAPAEICNPGESPIECEFRVHKPSIVLVRLGTNDAGSAEFFEDSLRDIIHIAMARGVIPVLGTKADLVEGDDRNNAMIRRLAAEYGLPLWDFAHVARTLPNDGLRDDGIHLSYAAPDYTQADAFQSGHAVQNLTALMVLDAVWRSVMQEVENDTR